MPYNELIGKRFGRLVVRSVYRKQLNTRTRPFASATCDCGAITEVVVPSLKCGKSMIEALGVLS